MRVSTRGLAWFAAPALLLAGAAQGQDREAHYRFVSASDRQATFVDDPTLVREGATRTYWTLWVYITPQRGPDGDLISYRRVQFRQDCTAQTTEALRHIAYGENDQVLIDYRPELGPQAVGPGSVNADVSDYVCSGRLGARVDSLPLISHDSAIRVTRDNSGD